MSMADEQLYSDRVETKATEILTRIERALPDWPAADRVALARQMASLELRCAAKRDIDWRL